MTPTQNCANTAVKPHCAGQVAAYYAYSSRRPAH